MTNQSINFKKERDFGDLFNTTFNFIGQEFKRLGTVILYYVVPVLLLSAIVTTIYSVKLQDAMRSIAPASGNDPMLMLKSIGSIMGYASLAILLTLISSALLFSAVYCYIKLYVSRGRDGFTVNDVWQEMMKNFFKVLIAGFIVGILVCAGFCLCVIPGIYLGIALCLILCIMIFEEQAFSFSFSRSLKLVNPNWWLSFGVALISTVVVYALSLILSLPSVAMGFKSLFTSIKSGQVTEMNFSIGFYVITSLTNLISQFFYVIPIVLTALMYYSFVEKSEKTSLLEKIDQINEEE